MIMVALILKITDCLRIKLDFHAKKSFFIQWPYLWFSSFKLILDSRKDFCNLKTII